LDGDSGVPELDRGLTGRGGLVGLLHIKLGELESVEAYPPLAPF